MIKHISEMTLEEALEFLLVWVISEQRYHLENVEDQEEDKILEQVSVVLEKHLANLQKSIVLPTKPNYYLKLEDFIKSYTYEALDWKQ